MINGLPQSELLSTYISASKSTKGVDTVVRANSCASVSHTEKTHSTKKKVIAGTAIIVCVTSAALGFGVKFKREISNFFKKSGGQIFDNTVNNEKIRQLTEKSTKFRGGDNIINGKDAVTRHFLYRFKPYQIFDDFFSNIYKKTMLSSCTKDAKRALRKFNGANTMISEVMKDSDIDKSKILRMRKLLNKKKAGFEKFLKDENKRFTELDNSSYRLDKKAWDKMSEIKFTKNGITSAVKKYSKESLVDSSFAKMRTIQDNALCGYANGSLTAAENQELNELLEEICKDNGRVLAKMQDADRLLNKSLIKESNDLVEKIRDVNCGSAPTDMITAFTAAAGLAIGISRADSKEEAVSATLTTGIPLGVALGTTVAATCNMVGGIKGLILGGATGFLANKLGSKLDKVYKKSKGITNPEDEQSSG